MRSPRRLCLAALAALALLPAAAPARELFWRALDVRARLNAEGRLDVVETQTMVFTGDWNGGERTFRVFPGQSVRLKSLTRISEDGARHPLEAADLSRIDQYAWSGENVLRWRSRLPSDPEFADTEIVYELDYAVDGVLRKEGSRYVLDHDFAFPDRAGPIERFTLSLELDPVWKPESRFAPTTSVGPLPSGQGYVLTIPMTYAGTGRPEVGRTTMGREMRYALLAILAAAVAFLGFALWKREKALGRFAPLTPPEAIDAKWLEENLLTLRPEEAGALWDESIGRQEVAAILARLAAEKKISTKADGKKLSMRRLVPLGRFDGYEESLVHGLFYGNREETDTESIRKHYKTSGFDPVSKIKPGLEARLKTLPDFQDLAPKPSRAPTLVLLAAGLLCLAAAAITGQEEKGTVIGGLIGVAIVWGLGLIGARAFQGRITKLAASSLLFLWVPALLLYLAWAGVRDGLRSAVLFAIGALLLRLALLNNVFNVAKIRNGPRRIARRKALTSARNFFVRELARPSPSLRDEWFPYVVAFGLTSEADRWFRAHGAAASASTAGGWTGASSGSSSSSSSSGGGWTGGGGAFGGAGASGSWAVAAGALAAGVATPSSSGGSGGGGGGGGGGSSGGGGGGGW